jgi:beta-mannosidase
MQTISSFTEPGDLNIFSRIMEMHQRNEGANGKILTYLSKNFLYPTSLEKLVYASQLLQAEAIKYGVEHWRRNRGRCMGAIYWQLNDIWPTASWASIDYFGRWKALHYYAKRFFSPVMISCEEIGEGAYKESVIDEPGGPISAQAKLCVANESLQTVDGVVKWRLCSPGSEIHQQGEISVTIEKLSSFWLDELDFGYMDFLNIHLQYELIVNEKIISSGSVLFTEPKHYHFIDPHLSYTTDGSTVHILTEAYAKSVEVLSNDPDFLVSDNYFDMEKGEVVLEVIRGTVDSIKLQSVFDIR